MTTESPENSASCKQRRRISTRQLGAFVAAAAAPAAAMIAPAAAQATTQKLKFFTGCINPGSGNRQYGPGRTPHWMVASGSGRGGCNYLSLGWVWVGVFEPGSLHGWTSATGHGYARTKQVTGVPNTFDACSNGGAHPHWYSCWSYRSF